MKKKVMNISGISNGTCGPVYFKDGQTEPILYLVHYEEDLVIEINTCSGRYLYYSYTVPLTKYTNSICKVFYKSVISADDFGWLKESLVLCDDIDHIELCA